MNENGEEVQQISYSDLTDFKKKVKEIMKKLKSEQVALSEVVFLAPKKYHNSILGTVNN